jgi:hypothetical protein
MTSVDDDGEYAIVESDLLLLCFVVMSEDLADIVVDDVDDDTDPDACADEDPLSLEVVDAPPPPERLLLTPPMLPPLALDLFAIVIGSYFLPTA